MLARALALDLHHSSSFVLSTFVARFGSSSPRHPHSFPSLFLGALPFRTSSPSIISMHHVRTFARPLAILSVLALLSSALPEALAALVNVTVDDATAAITGASITYAPSGAWRSGPGCSSCVTSPDVGETHNGTWHEGQFWGVGDDAAKSELQTATLQFNGA